MWKRCIELNIIFVNRLLYHLITEICQREREKITGTTVSWRVQDLHVQCIERFLYDLESGFDKCLIFVLSANGWKDQNMASLFSHQRKSQYGESIVWLANHVPVWHQRKVQVMQQVISRKFSGMKFFHPSVRLTNPKAKCICIRWINQSNHSISIRLLFLFWLHILMSRSYENSSKNWPECSTLATHHHSPLWNTALSWAWSFQDVLQPYDLLVGCSTKNINNNKLMF